MSRRRLPWLLGLALALAGAWLLQTWAPGVDEPPAPLATESVQDPAETDVTDSSPPAGDPMPGAPLPDESLPLPQRLAELERLASAGHPQASCRLVIERLRCRQLRRWDPDKGARSRELRFESEGHLELANEVAEANLLRIRQKQDCRNAPPIESTEALALLGQAAAAGHAPSSLLYFQIGHEFRRERGIFRHPHFDAWRRDAPRRLQSAFEAGHPGAAHALGRAYLDDGDFANGLVPDDARQAYLHLRLAARLSGGRRRIAENFDMGLDEQTRAELDAQARQLHRERFGDRTYDSPEMSTMSPHRQPALSATDFCTARKAL